MSLAQAISNSYLGAHDLEYTVLNPTIGKQFVTKATLEDGTEVEMFVSPVKFTLSVLDRDTGELCYRKCSGQVVVGEKQVIKEGFNWV